MALLVITHVLAPNTTVSWRKNSTMAATLAALAAANARPNIAPRTINDEWDCVHKGEPVGNSGRLWRCICKYCAHPFSGNQGKIREHILAVAGGKNNLRGCDKVPDDVRKAVQVLQARASAKARTGANTTSRKRRREGSSSTPTASPSPVSGQPHTLS